MNQKKRFLSFVLIIMVVITMFAFTGCSKDSDTQTGEAKGDANKPDWPSSVTLISGPVGGPWYPVMVIIAEYLTKEIPEISWTVIDGGSLANIRVVNEGIDAQIGLTHLNMLEKAMEGKLSVMKDETIDKVSIGNALTNANIQIVAPAKYKDINNLKDLFDKRFAAGKLTSAQPYVVEDLFAFYGESYQTVPENGGKIEYINFSEMATLLQDGHIDAACFAGDIPHASAMEADISVHLKMLKIDDEALDNVIKMYPSIMKLTAPADTYSGMTEPVVYPGVACPLIFNKEKLPGDLIYKITRVIMENSEDIVNAYSNRDYLCYLNWEDTLKFVTEEKCDPNVWRAVKEGPKK